MSDDLFQRSPIGFVTTDQIDFFLRRVEVDPTGRVETPTQKAVRTIQGDAVRAFAENLKAASDATETVAEAADRIYREKSNGETPGALTTNKIQSIKTLRDLKGLNLRYAKDAIESAITRAVLKADNDAYASEHSDADHDYNPNSDGEFDFYPDDDDDD